MDRLEAALAVAAPPPLAAAARHAGCPADGIRELVRSGRIVELEPDLAYAATTYGELDGRARSAMAATEPLTPAAFRDATGHEPQVRHGDPRRPRPARRSCAGPRPATSPGRERARPTGVGG